MCGVYYHLSPNHIYAKVGISTEYREGGIILAPRVPLDCYGEDSETPRICVAPTVWQCAISIPRTGKLYIYEIHPRRVTNVNLEMVIDQPVTSEKWLTDSDILEFKEEIKLRSIGNINITKHMQMALKIANRQGKLNGVAEGGLWRIDTVGEWQLDPKLLAI